MSLTLATNVVLLSAGTGAANASVTGVLGQVITEAPPALVAQGTIEDNRQMRLFEERSDDTLPTALPVDIAAPSTYPATYSQLSQLTSTTVPAGTKVDSYMVFSDPVGRPTVKVPYAATITFSSPILGVIVQDKTLDTTDATVGAPGTTYQAQSMRGLEVGTDSDQVELLSPDTINIRTMTSYDTDQVRIITAGTPYVAGTTLGAPNYTEVASDGGIFNFNSRFYGSEGGTPLNRPMVGGANALATGGYWTVASDGGIFSFGGAPFYGSTGGLALTRPIVAMSPTGDGLGYWLFASDGGVFSFGDATYYGSEGGFPLNKPVVGGAADPGGSGYWMVASDGGIFSFGTAAFFGSTGGMALNQPIVGMTPTPDGKGYWLVARDGGIFSFGDAAFYGSTGDLELNAPIVGMKSSPDGKGYWLIASDGGVFSFGDATFLGSEGGAKLNQPIVGVF